MVAYTTPDCLPYFEGADSPCLNTGTFCEPSTVWCDFAETLESKLVSLDETASVAQFPPMAWVETTTSFNVAVGGGLTTIPVFDTVRVDTADMVNLDADSSGFAATRSGLYTVFGYLYGTVDTPVAASAEITLNIEFTPNMSLYGAGSINNLTASHTAPLDGSEVAASIHSVVPWSIGQRLVAQITSNGPSGTVFTLTKVTLGAFWVGDLP